MSGNSKLAGHLAVAGAYLIFGFNIIFCKDIANSGNVPPMTLFLFRMLGATILFWLVSLFIPREKVDRQDYPRILLASILGLFVPQASFLLAITTTTSIDTAVLGTLSPIFTMIFAAIFLKEPITFKKTGGVIMSFVGILFLIFNSVHSGNGVEHSSMAGMVLMLVNGISFGLYLGMFRPLISKYKVTTFMKWSFLFTLVLCLPFSLTSLSHASLGKVSSQVGLEIAFVVVFSTFVAYFLIPFAQKKLRPTVVSMYSYLQPIIATAVSISIGMDSITWEKMVAIVLVFTGLALVNRSRAAGDPAAPVRK